MEVGIPAESVNHALIARAQAGDEAAFGALFESYRRGVFRYLYYRLGDHLAAEDLTAEVFLRVVKALPGYQSRGAPFPAWIYRIARNLVVDYCRQASHRQHLPLDDELAAGDNGGDPAADGRLGGERLRAALARLTGDQRDVITLRFVSEMPIAEVAATLGKSETAIKALQRRGLEALRTALAGKGVP